MIKYKRLPILAMLCVLLLLVSSLLIMCPIINHNAYATTKEYFSAERYTESDYLLKTDGTESTRTINNFADDVKSGKHRDIFQEFEQVVPLEYLEWQETYATFYYMGSEYGFYVEKRDFLFFTLLIDFIYEGDSSGTDFTIRIKPILQQCFKRNRDGTEYVWTKEGDETNKFYVANPCFDAVLFNENALNYGDNGYSKYTDDGAIISHAITNFSSVNLVKKSMWSLAGSVLGESFFGLACTALDCYTGTYLGSAIQYLKSTYGYVKEIYEVEEDEESDINFYYSTSITSKLPKEEQRSKSDVDHYSRCTSFETKQQDNESNYLISAAENSFAEYVVMLDKISYRSRLILGCSFNIMARRNSFGGCEDVVDENGEKISFSTTYTRVLFENRNPKFEINNDFPEDITPVYMLPGGKQDVSFTPRYSGLYDFNVTSGVILTLNGVKGNSFNLNEGQTYKLELSSKIYRPLIGSLSCSIQNVETNEAYSIAPHSSRIIKYQPTASNYLKVLPTNANAKIGLLNQNMQIIQEDDYNCAHGYFIAGQTYYFVITNDTNMSFATQISLGAPNQMSLQQNYNVVPDNRIINFKNSDSVKRWYKLEMNKPYFDAVITDSSNMVLSTEPRYTSSNTVYIFSLGANENCYVSFVSVNSSVTVQISISPTQFRWFVDGKEVDGFAVRIKPNSVHLIRGELSVNGGNFNSVQDISILKAVSGCVFSSSEGKLTINSVANNTQISLGSDSAAYLALIVTIDDMLTKITLDHAGGSGFNGEINVELNHYIPTITKPQLIGSTFKGYYDAPQGVSGAKQYITENMQGQVWDKDVDDAKLYAHWEKIKYTLTFDNSAGSSGRYNRFILEYGSDISNLKQYAPKRDGYSFVGYYINPQDVDKESNGIWYDKGTKYYSVTENKVNDAQSASIYGYSQYLVEGIAFCHNDKAYHWDTSITLYAHWTPMCGGYYCQHICDGQATTSTFVSLIHNEATTIKAQPITGYDFKCFALDGVEQSGGDTFVWTPSLRLSPATGEVVPTQTLTIIYTKSECVAEGTLITLADGRQVAVETLTGNELLLVWNMYTGQFDSARILFIDKHATKEYNVVNLGFADGTTVRVIGEHAFWDCNLNKYVYLDVNASQYIGHYFNKQITNADGSMGNANVQLTSVEITTEYTTAYSPVTADHLCYYVNGMLSIPGGITGLFNIFDVDQDTMKIDVEAMEQDIAQYGLFTYEEFSALMPITEEAFNALNGQYLKIAIGKGLTTVERLAALAERYAEYLI